MARRRPKGENIQVKSGTPGNLLHQALGVTNLGRAFKADQTWNGPQIALRTRRNAFGYSWSHGTRSDQDPSAALTTGSQDPTVALYPICPMAEAFNDNHWPLLLSLLQSGTGSRYNTSINEVVRYYSIVSSLLENILVPLQLNYLTTTFDWSQIAPYTESIPPAVWGLTELFDATDIGVADTWKPLYERLSTKVLPPNLNAAVQEGMFPYLGDPNGHVLRMNISTEAASALGTWTIDDYITGIMDKLDYLEGSLINCHNTLASFLPWRVGSPIAMFKGYDPTFEEIDYNSALSDYAFFGDTGDPSESRCIACGDGTSVGDSILYYHRGAIPLAKAVLNTSIWEVIDDVTDDEYMLITPVKGGGVNFLDDNLNLISYDGSPAASETAQRYRDYWPTRWNNDAGELTGGRGRKGFLPSLMSKEEVIRTTKLYTDWLFSNSIMKEVIGLTGGSSVRTIYESVARAWAGRTD